jgi:hypothetical protein
LEVKRCKVIILSEKVPNSKPMSSCRHAIKHFSSDELGILEGLRELESWGRGVVELICRGSRLAPHGLSEPSAKI